MGTASFAPAQRRPENPASFMTEWCTGRERPLRSGVSRCNSKQYRGRHAYSHSRAMRVRGSACLRVGRARASSHAR
eukprot:3484967-Lingulodinium_polyedra.AAC.1